VNAADPCLLDHAIARLPWISIKCLGTTDAKGVIAFQFVSYTRYQNPQL